MASPDKRLPANVGGDFFVDSTCIDCATCRWMAPETYNEANDQSRVYQQPTSAAAVGRALRALVACPTGSIGVAAKKKYRAEMRGAVEAFPIPIAENVHHCGYHAESSFGAASYLIVRPEGNVMIDSPRFAKPLVEQIEKVGGVATLLLTHQDDVADHEAFHRHFGCKRVIHRNEAKDKVKSVEHAVDGEDAVSLDPDLLSIPTPGHTCGSMCFLYRERFLFTGDHLAWSPSLKQLYAFKDACWFDWETLKRSMEKLAAYRFEWVLPGHGWPAHFSAEQMKNEMNRCIAWMTNR